MKQMTLMQKIMIVAGSLALISLSALVVNSCNFEKPSPKFRNGDMVTHILSEREGQVIDNSYKFNGKSECWQVKVRMKKTKEIKKSLATKFFGEKASGMFNNIPETFNEFELEKR